MPALIRSLDAIADQAWGLPRSILAQLIDHVSHPEGAVKVLAQAGVPSYLVGAVAVIPVRGMTANHSSWLMDLFGGTSYDGLRASLRQYLADPQVASIVFDIDSPGGYVSGMTELAAEIRAARGQKRIVAVANTDALSCAYWIASQADELIVTPSGRVGSIGIYAVHEDISAALEDAGVKVTIISAGEHKTEGNEYEPLTDDARAQIQKLVDASYAQFTGDVAKGRRTTTAKVEADYGQGRVLLPSEALAAGMVDGIDTLENTVRRVARAQPGGNQGRRAEGEGPELVAEAPEPFRERLEHLAEELTSLVEHATVRASLRAKEGRPAFSAITEGTLRSIREGLTALLPADPAAPPPAVDPPKPPVQPAPVVVPPQAAKPRFRSDEEWQAFLTGDALS